MNKRHIPVYQVSSEYADCIEKAFGVGEKAAPGAASEGAVSLQRQQPGETILGAMGNTPLSGSLFGQISEDTVHLSLWVDWGMEKDDLFRRLRDCQQESRGRAEAYIPDENGEGSEPGTVLDFDPDEFIAQEEMASGNMGTERYIEGHGAGWFEFGNCLWRVLPNGMGGKDGRSYYPYAIASGGVIMGFRRDKHETVSNVWLEIGSIPLAQHDGLHGVWDMLKKMFAKEGIHIEKDLVSRVDIYADFDTCEVDEFCTRFYDNRRVTRARKIGQFNDDLNFAVYMVGFRRTGFSIGTHIKLRCYDKKYELKNDPIKTGVFAQKYGGIPSILTRVEFQLRRLALKEFLIDGKDRIDGVDSYLHAREKLWRYLTEDWFRLTEDDVDSKNKHQARAKTWSIWEMVQKAVTGVTKEIFRHKRALKIDMEHLYKMAVGCICKMAVYECGRELETAGDVVKHFVQKIRKHGIEEFSEILRRHMDGEHHYLGFNPIV